MLTRFQNFAKLPRRTLTYTKRRLQMQTMNKVLRMRVTLKQWLLLRRTARRAGMSVSEYMRSRMPFAGVLKP